MPYKKEKMVISKAFGAELRRIRKEKGLRAIDVGDSMGYTESVVCMWERGETLISIDILYSYCIALNINASVVMHKIEKDA